MHNCERTTCKPVRETCGRMRVMQRHGGRRSRAEKLMVIVVKRVVGERRQKKTYLACKTQDREVLLYGCCKNHGFSALYSNVITSPIAS
jgi:hypothetical protein